MNAFEVYKFYSAVKLHFTSKKYDFFKYSGAINRSPSTFENLNEYEKTLFLNVSRMREPKTFIVGNLMFNPSNYIRDFTDQYFIEYRKYLVNGEYIFKRDLNRLKKPYPFNFSVDSDNEIPYILNLYLNEDITLFTSCVFQKLIDWTSKIQIDFIKDTTDKINKSVGFFKIEKDKYKQIIVNS